MRVLVVEDEEMLAETITDGLRDQTIAICAAHDGAEALYRTGYTDYDVIVLDRDLPGVHGDEVCRQLVARRSNSNPVATEFIRVREVRHSVRAHARGKVSLTVLRGAHR
ncbi:response regulator [Streptomyces sp. NRRL S-448]|uniref:response regulator n=1 Tax=Streptomyces sp. NRRL S-448 TaxID=1463907 RepID=UPI003561B0C3